VRAEPGRLLVLLTDAPTRVLFFTGKGGVGKTSVACATAVRLARAGRRVLLVSTDPASNLDEVLGVSLAPEPRPVPGVPGLAAANLDPVAAAAAWRERAVGPYRGLLPAAAITSMEEQLSGACTVEIAAFDAFSQLLGDPAATAAYDHVVFDTAPTGHTLRLLALPAAWSDFLETSTGGASCLGPLAGLEGQRHLYAATVAALTDPAQTTLVLVARPETSALREAERTRAELDHLGVSRPVLVVNGVFRSVVTDDPLATAMEARGAAALAALPPGLAALPRVDLPLLAVAPMGAAGVEGLLAGVVTDPALPPAMDPPATGTLAALVATLAAPGHGLVMTMGKGGVGKTTVAAAVAVALARRGHRVHLSTTDPAAHLADTVALAVPGLTVSRIDPAAETAAYTAEVLATAGAGLDARGRALLEEDLRSPCTEEIAVFRAFARTVAEAAGGFVVLDTAPTGHTLLLLDASEAYHREVSRVPSATPDFVRSLLPRLRDPAFTRVLLVTLPEATPVHEAAALGRDLARAGIHPFAWVVNASLTPLALRDPILRARRAHEAPYLAEVVATGAPVALVPWQAEAPTGPDRLAALAGG
jgi:arsenite-transporting ATPase